MDKVIFLINLIPDIVMVASIVCAMTPTPKDDELLSKAYKILEIFAINIGKAKMPSK
jgi:hypothetical protein